MARYRATIKGQRGATSRLGSPGSGIEATVNGWDTGVKVLGHPCRDCGRDVFEVWRTGGSNGGGHYHVASIHEYHENVRSCPDAQKTTGYDEPGSEGERAEFERQTGEPMP